MNDDEYPRCCFDWNFQHITITVEVILKIKWIGNHDHIEIHSLSPEGHPLPISMSPFRSYWPGQGKFTSVEEAARAIAQWIDEKSESKEWLDYVRESAQMTLF